jgi:tRNA A37 threonylcarbamoyladenosine modification protein TsaB
MSIQPEVLCKHLENIEKNFYFIGDGAVRYREIFEKELGKRFKIAKDNNIKIAISVARLGLEKIKRGDIPHVASLIPNYIRASDAELKFR